MPVSLNENFRGDGDDCPCFIVNGRFNDPSCNWHGGRTVNDTVKDCTDVLEPSVAVIDTFVLYAPAFKPARFAVTVIGTDWPLAASKPDAGDNVNQLAACVIVAFQLKGQAQLPLAVIESV